MIELDREIAEAIDDDELFRLAEGGEHEFSPKYNDAMEKMFRKARAHPKRRMQPIRRIIAVAAIIAALSGTVAAAAFWEEIWQFIVVSFGQYAELRAEEPAAYTKPDFSMIPEEWGNFWCPRLENKDSIISAELIGSRMTITFQSNTGVLSLSQWRGKRDVNIDNDAKAVEGITVGDVGVYAIEKEGGKVVYRTIVWIIEDVTLELSGSCSFDEITGVANSLLLIER